VSVARFAPLAPARGDPVHVAAMVLSTAGQIRVRPTVPAAAAVTAPERRGAAMQGGATRAGPVGRMIGPPFGGAHFPAEPSAVFRAMAAAAAVAGGIDPARDRAGVATLAAS
jgi:hypothetical protein